jgi:hypothetical protein
VDGDGVGVPPNGDIEDISSRYTRINVGGRIALAYWVDLLWFASLGFGDVFWKTLGLQTGISTGFAVVTFILLYGAFSVIRRTHQAYLPRAHCVVIAGQQVSLSVEGREHLGVSGEKLIPVLRGMKLEERMECQPGRLRGYAKQPRKRPNPQPTTNETTTQGKRRVAVSARFTL